MIEPGVVAIEAEEAPPTVGAPIEIELDPERGPGSPPAPGAETPMPGNANAAIEGFGN